MDSQNLAAVRLSRLRAVMKEQGLAAFLVRDTPSIAWLTAFEEVFDSEQAHALLVCDAGAWLHTDSRYAEACRAAASGGPVTVDLTAVPHARWALELYERELEGSELMEEMSEGADHVNSKSLRQQIADDMKEVFSQDAFSVIPPAVQAEARRPEALRLGVEESLALGEYLELRAGLADSSFSLELTPTKDLIMGLRAVKDDAEIAAMKRAQAITDEAFARVLGLIRPSMTEQQLRRTLDDCLYDAGATDLAFPTIVAAGAHAASPHAIPGDRAIEVGDAIVMDFGACWQGYCSDMTRTVFVGDPSEEQRRAYELLRRVNEEVEARLAPGMTGKEAHELAERLLEEGGFGGLMGHGLGHGVGMQVHEQPVLSPRNDRPLAAGNVVTVEPGIYLPGAFGMRLEDFGVLTDGGFEVFTQTSHEMVIIGVH